MSLSSRRGSRRSAVRRGRGRGCGGLRREGRGGVLVCGPGAAREPFVWEQSTAAIRARSRLSMAVSPYAFGHDISRPFTMRNPPRSPASCAHPVLRGASMQQVRCLEEVPKLRVRKLALHNYLPDFNYTANDLKLLHDAQLNMDVIEKRVSGNERVHNWWAVEAWSDPVALPGDPGVPAELPLPPRPTLLPSH
ncbi:unnamed protein product [Colias eurytheme]|nr:unnamed protein product [Colias eurytheme]